MAKKKSGKVRLVLRGVVAAAALVFAGMAYIWITLPDVRPLRDDRPETTAFMELRAREARAAGKPATKQHRWIAYRSISPNLTRAVIVAEDAAFWSHKGIDFHELRASLSTSWQRREFPRGASTITQQLAKNLYLSPSRNPVRKVEEWMIARRLEAELSKVRIFELYLNEIEWGNGIWGAEAASRAYFGKSAADLSPQQAAIMAGAIINPRIYSPGRPNARLLRRQQIILRRMGAGVSASEPSAVPEDDARDDVRSIEELLAE